MIDAAPVAAMIAVTVAAARIHAVAIGPTVVAVAIAIPAIVAASIDRAAVPAVVAAAIDDRRSVAAVTGIAHWGAPCEGDGKAGDDRAAKHLHDNPPWLVFVGALQSLPSKTRINRTIITRPSPPPP
jgi:hypothetical protein